MDAPKEVESIKQKLAADQFEGAATLFETVFNALLEANAVDKELFPETDLLKLSRLLRIWSGREDDGSDSFSVAETKLEEIVKKHNLNPIDGDYYTLAQMVLDRINTLHGKSMSPARLIEQAWLHHECFREDRALRLFDIALKQSVRLTSEERLSALRGKAATLTELDRPREANDALTEAVAADGVAPPAIRLDLGWLRFDEGAYDLAFKDFKIASQDKLDDEDRFLARVGQLMASRLKDTKQGGDSADALVRSWLEAREIETNYAVALLTTSGRTHNVENRYYPALGDANLILEIARPGTRPKANAYAAKIEALQWMRKYDEAEQIFREAHKEFPADLGIWKSMGYSLYWQRRFAESLSFYEGKGVKDDLEMAEANRRKLLENLADDKDAAEWRAVQLRNLRQLGEADTLITEAISKFGETVGLLTERGYVHYSRGNYELAIKEFDRALSTDPYCAFACQWRLAAKRRSASLGNKRLDMALEEIKKVIQKQPREAGLWEEYGWISFERKDLKTAEECFQKAIKIDPYFLRRYFSRVEVLMRLNLNDDARAVFTELLAMFPKDREVIEQYGWFNLRQGKLDEAFELFNSIILGSPVNRWVSPADAPGVNGLGGYYLERLEYESAEFHFRRAVQAVSHEPQYKVNLASALVQQVRDPGETPRRNPAARENILNEAAQLCCEALALDPQNAKAHSCLGVIAFKRGRYLESETQFLKAASLSPAEGAYVDLAALYAQMGNYENARQNLRLAFEFNHHDARAHLELGNLLLLTNRNEEAILECRQAASIDRNNYEGYRALSIALMHTGNYEEAERIIRDGLKCLRPNREWQLRLALAQILIQLGDKTDKDPDRYAEALKQVTQAQSSVALKNADILFHAGVAQFKLEDYRASRRSFRACVKANGDRYDAARYVRLLDKVIRQERTIARNNFWGGWALSVFCVTALVTLWGVHAWGKRIPRPPSATSEIVSNSSKKTEPDPQAAVAPKSEKSENAPANAEASILPSSSPAKEDLVVDKTMLTVLSPILLGLMVIGLLLPNLNKIKLPGGIEAEIIETRTKEISSGPKAEIGFGSSLPSISPGPR